MKFIQLKCPNCHADLQINAMLTTCYCQYCGTKLLIEGQSDTVVQAHTKVRLADKAIELEKVKHKNEMEKEDQKQKHQMEKSKQSNRDILLFVGLMLGILIIMEIGFKIIIH